MPAGKKMIRVVGETSRTKSSIILLSQSFWFVRFKTGSCQSLSMALTSICSGGKVVQSKKGKGGIKGDGRLSPLLIVGPVDVPDA
jgi:hypothetical protein